MALLYINLIGAEQAAFAAKVQTVSAKLGIDPNWLMQVMYSESRVDPQSRNPRTNATGLIQFMPSTARSLGTTVDALFSMSAVQQLDYVYKYFIPWKGKMHSYYDVYASVFFPAMIGKPDDWVLHTSSLSAETIARQNPAVNINKDGKITVGEFKQYVKNTVANRYWQTIFSLPGNTLLLLITATAAFFF